MMRAMIWLLAMGGLASALAACATKSSFNYTPGPTKKIENTTILPQKFDMTWDILVKNLAQDYFVINNIEKSSRIINVSFSTETPNDYIDCGSSSRIYTNATGQQERFVYPVANDSIYKSTQTNGLPYLVARRTSLDGRTNIYLAPHAQGSEITANTRYVFSVSLTIQGMNRYEVPIGPPVTKVLTNTFSTNQPSRKPITGGVMVCASRNVLEKRILRAATRG